MKHLIERAIDHAVDVADRDDKEEMVRMMRDCRAILGEVSR